MVWLFLYRHFVFYVVPVVFAFANAVEGQQVHLGMRFKFTKVSGDLIKVFGGESDAGDHGNSDPDSCVVGKKVFQVIQNFGVGNVGVFQMLHRIQNLQVEEEEVVDDVIQKLKLMGDFSGGLYLLDRELLESTASTAGEAGTE